MINQKQGGAYAAANGLGPVGRLLARYTVQHNPKISDAEWSDFVATTHRTVAVTMTRKPKRIDAYERDLDICLAVAEYHANLLCAEQDAHLNLDFTN